MSPFTAHLGFLLDQQCFEGLTATAADMAEMLQDLEGFHTSRSVDE